MRLFFPALLVPVYFMFSSTGGPVAASLLQQSLRFQFVGVGETVQISCTAAEPVRHGGIAFSWYRRQARGIHWVRNCFFNQAPDKFVCRVQGRDLTLEIAQVQKEDSGTYFCAEHIYINFSFSTGTSLIVGDSYTPSTWVTVLQPQGAHYVQNASDSLACLVCGVSNSVQVSWQLPGGLRQEGRTLLVQNRSGSLTFLSLLRVPVDVWGGGGPYTCEVRFNSSGPPVRRSAASPAPLLLAQAGHCPSSTVSLVVATGLSLLLLLLLIVLWIQFGPSRPDSYTPSSRVRLLQPPAAPAPQSEQSSHLACLVHGVSGLVQVSWHLPGGLRREGRTLLAQNRSGSLTFLSLLRVPADSWPRGQPFACEVRLNASDPGIRRNGTWLPARFQPPASGTPSSEEPQENISYTELHFPSRTRDRKKRR
ncbi:hypothetical protein lerEdw1_011555 [Lerista edwardsae]|nr:hypothetical protein lerEdw1_011555 [Lerista edwardsae]